MRSGRRKKGGERNGGGISGLRPVSVAVLVLCSTLVVGILALVGVAFAVAASSRVKFQFPGSASVQAMGSVCWAAGVRLQRLDILVRAIAVVFLHAGVNIYPFGVLSTAAVVFTVVAAAAWFQHRSVYAQILVISGSDRGYRDGGVLLLDAADDAA